jgi:hypothetical protein
MSLSPRDLLGGALGLAHSTALNRFEEELRSLLLRGNGADPDDPHVEAGRAFSRYADWCSCLATEGESLGERVTVNKTALLAAALQRAQVLLWSFTL